MAVAVKLGEMDDLDSHVLEHLDEIGRQPGGAPRLFLERGHGNGHVPVAGKGVITGQLGEAVLMGISERLAECSLGVPARDQEENAQVLLAAGRSVEPGDERAAPTLGLANAEAEPGIEPLAISPVPGGLLVVGQVARVIRTDEVAGSKRSPRLSSRPRSSDALPPAVGPRSRRRGRLPWLCRRDRSRPGDWPAASCWPARSRRETRSDRCRVLTTASR